MDVDCAPVLALCAAALELVGKGHLSRATDRWAQAVEAAQALGQTDCLIVAWCLLEQAQHDLAQTAVLDVPVKDKNRQRFQRKIALTASVLPSLRRRRAAGTLAPGGCREWEEKFRVGRAQLATQVTVEGAAATLDQLDEFARQIGPLVGYEAAMTLASLWAELVVVSCAQDVDEGGQRVAASHTAWLVECLDAFCARMAAAPEGGVPVCESDSLVLGYLGEHVQRLWPQNGNAVVVLDAWARVQAALASNGMRDNVNDIVRAARRAASDNEQATEAWAATSGLRRCHKARCGARERHPAQFKACSACKKVVYCTKECQTADYPEHRAACKAQRAATAEKEARRAAVAQIVAEERAAQGL
jgi:hypothetical protein